MSSWTHVLGIARVWAEGESQHQVEYNLKSVIAHLPVVSGSERNMDISIKQISGSSVSSNTDEFGHFSNLGNNGHGGLFWYQPEYTVTFVGDLRDRHFQQTYREFVNMLVRFSKRIAVDNVLVDIWEDYGKRSIIMSSPEYGGYWYDLSYKFGDSLELRMKQLRKAKK